MSLLKKKNKFPPIFLSVIFIISLVCLIVVKTGFVFYSDQPYSRVMKKSVELTKQWFTLVSEKKKSLGIESDAVSSVPYKNMLGNDFTEITTTLGSLEAKELATNPGFAAVIAKLLLESGVDSTSTVGVVISGSFPSLAVSSLAALQTIGAGAVLISSLGASSYGANQPNATWIDIETWLRKEGGLKFNTSILTAGAENDIGEGLTEDGLNALTAAAQRNGVELFAPHTLEHSIKMKTDFLVDHEIDCLINIGGNQASLGSCAHAVGIANGLNVNQKICDDENRGIIARIAENGIPFIHLLNIKDLAVKNNIPLEPGTTYGSADALYKIKRIDKAPVIVSLIIISSLIFFYYKRFVKQG